MRTADLAEDPRLTIRRMCEELVRRFEQSNKNGRVQLKDVQPKLQELILACDGGKDPDSVKVRRYTQAANRRDELAVALGSKLSWLHPFEIPLPTETGKVLSNRTIRAMRKYSPGLYYAPPVSFKNVPFGSQLLGLFTEQFFDRDRSHRRPLYEQHLPTNGYWFEVEPTNKVGPIATMGQRVQMMTLYEYLCVLWSVLYKTGMQISMNDLLLDEFLVSVSTACYHKLVKVNGRLYDSGPVDIYNVALPWRPVHRLVP